MKNCLEGPSKFVQGPVSAGEKKNLIKINHNGDNNFITEKSFIVLADESLGCTSHPDLRVLQYLCRNQLNVAARDGGNEDA